MCPNKHPVVVMMGILENLIMPSTSTDKPTKKVQGGATLYPGDFGKIAKWCVIGAVGFSAYQTAVMMAKRNVNACVDFKDPVEAMHNDPIIRDSLIQMQNYRELNPWLFKTALQNIDQLLFLENALLSQSVYPAKKDKDIAFTYFRMGVNRLSQFHFLVTKELGTEHGMTVNILLKRIYAQMQKHLLNILHLCSQFNPENLIARAPLEVQSALRRIDQGRPPPDSSALWDKMRGKLDRDEQRRHHRSGKSHRRHRHHRHRHDDKDGSSSSEDEHTDRRGRKSEKHEKHDTGDKHDTSDTAGEKTVDETLAEETTEPEPPVEPPSPEKIEKTA